MSDERESSSGVGKGIDNQVKIPALVSVTQEYQKVEVRNREFHDSVVNADLSKGIYAHVYAVRIKFERVNFEKSSWTNCYFRNCQFIDCDFTGCNFKESSFKGSEFKNCNLRYTFWDKTLIDESILDSCRRAEENLTRDIVRALRVNFAQLGNQDAVNKAILMEIELTGAHMLNIAKSKQEYYRRKTERSTVFQRLLFWLHYIWWLFVEVLCGFGERPERVFIWIMLTPSIALLILQFCDHSKSYLDCFLQAHEIFWGLKSTSPLPSIFSMILIGCRFLLLSVFTASLVKRLLRR